MLGSFRPTNHLQISLELAMPTQTPWLSSEGYKVIHGPNGLWLVQLISTIPLWIHAVHFKCHATCMDPSGPPNTPKSAWFWQCPHKHHGFFQRVVKSHMAPVDCDWWNTWVPFLYGSMLSISSVAGHAWTLRAHQTPPNQPGSGSALSDTVAVFSLIWSHAWPQWPVTGATHQYNSFMDLCCPFQV
jgi:hypothetical protein